MSGAQAGVMASSAPVAAAFTASLAGFGWALWLATPVAATAVAALVSWWRGRTPGSLSPERAAEEHQRYLDALGRATAGLPAPHPPADEPVLQPGAYESARTVTARPAGADGPARL